MSDTAIAILREKKIKITSCRVEILKLFLHTQKSFSLQDLEIILAKQCDRSSMFRNLKTFSEKRILDTLIGSKGGTLYTLNQKIPNCKNDSHFRCQKCSTVFLLPSLPSSYFSNLGKNKMEKMHLLIEGTCEKCQNNQSRR